MHHMEAKKKASLVWKIEFSPQKSTNTLTTNTEIAFTSAAIVGVILVSRFDTKKTCCFLARRMIKKIYIFPCCECVGEWPHSHNEAVACNFAWKLFSFESQQVWKVLSLAAVFFSVSSSLLWNEFFKNYFKFSHIKFSVNYSTGKSKPAR